MNTQCDIETGGKPAARTLGPQLRRMVERNGRARSGNRDRAQKRSLGFSLFLWGNDDAPGRDKYRLMLEGARYFDRAGFEAVWTPERHFHAFGGPYPNPSVTAAAIATVTERIGIRAGSCVSPLHHPIRIAEEWAVVDNLSNGRVALAFASGWQPNDFVLRPENHGRNKEVMRKQIDQVRRLWRGEKVAFLNPKGEAVPVQTLPRPVQPELPVWITAAGNPDTYRLAGELGANILTHLLGQSLEEVGKKIDLYRQARSEAGFDPATGQVTLMLHTLVGKNDADVREQVRLPMKNYLRSSLKLLFNGSGLLPDFKHLSRGGKDQDLDLRRLSEGEIESMLDFAFERYFETSGLFGSPETCARMAEHCRKAGVNEIACLMDFGVPTDDVLASLDHLNRVRASVNAGSPPAKPAMSVQDHSGQGSELETSPNSIRPVAALIRKLRDRDIQLTIEGDRLRCSAPTGALTAELQGELRQLKQDVLLFLRSADNLSQEPRSIVPLQPKGQCIPIFGVPGHNGDVFCFRSLSKHLGEDQPFHGLQPPGLDGNNRPLERIEDLASFFAGQIRSQLGSEPCVIAGFCAGGSTAFELARQLQADGVPVSMLILLGTPFPTLYRPLRGLQYRWSLQWERVVRHARMLASMPFPDQKRHIAQVLRNCRTSSIHDQEEGAGDDSVLQWRAAVEQATLKAIRCYRPGRFNGPLGLFVPSHQWMRNALGLFRWRKVSDRMEEYYGPPDCNSDNMLKDPNAPVFAELLRHALNNVR